MKTMKSLLVFVFVLSLGQSFISAAGTTEVHSQNALNCATGQLSLVLHFDNNPTQVNWQIKDANSVIYAQVYGYNSSNAGQTITETIPALGDGDYALVIFDSGGNGLCCSNGIGFYELLDGNNTVIATGGSYAHSEITTFCYNVSNNDVFDLQAPTDPVLSVSNITTTGLDLNWVASTDNVGVWAYGIFIDGVYADLSISTNYTIWYLAPGTTYEVKVLARDVFGNFSNFSNAFTITTLSNNTTTIAQQVSASYFESGWDGWLDGGADCSRYMGARAAEGNYAIRIRDDSGVKSSMTSDVMNLTSFDSIRVDFQYFHHGYEVGEDFFLNFFENGSYTTAKTFARGTDFNANGLYSGSVLLKSTDHTFTTNNRIRFQSDASENNDKIYIDAVVVTGYYQGSSSRIQLNESHVYSFFTEGLSHNTETRTTKKSRFDLTLFPNPVSDHFQLEGLSHDFNPIFRIYSVSGQLALETRYHSKMVDVSTLNSGIYFVIFQDESGELRSLNFVKN